MAYLALFFFLPLLTIEKYGNCEIELAYSLQESMLRTEYFFLSRLWKSSQVFWQSSICKAYR